MPGSDELPRTAAAPSGCRSLAQQIAFAKAAESVVFRYNPPLTILRATLFGLLDPILTCRSLISHQNLPLELYAADLRIRGLAVTTSPLIAAIVIG